MMNSIVSFFVWLLAAVIVLVLFPVSLLIWFITYPFDNERRLFHRWLVVQAVFVSRLIPFWTITVEGREKADPGSVYVIISNHQSMLDILVMNCVSMDFRWISKIENYRVPVIGWYLRMAKYITVDRGNKESKEVMMTRSAESLRKGISIMIFPEGTRSTDMQVGPFKLGAFQLAIMTDKPILPIIIDGTGGVLPKHGLVFSMGHKIHIRVLDPVHPGSFGTANPEELAEKFRTLIVTELEKLRMENGSR
ncbi:MAG: lysophospholipid acyltransferase family protein [Bacteroidales bacterium]